MATKAKKANARDEVFNRLTKEGLMKLRAAGERFFDGKVPVDCVRKWARDGNRSVDGVVVKLEAVKVGYHWYTSHAALKRFVRAINER